MSNQLKKAGFFGGALALLCAWFVCGLSSAVQADGTTDLAGTDNAAYHTHFVSINCQWTWTPGSANGTLSLSVNTINSNPDGSTEDLIVYNSFGTGGTYSRDGGGGAPAADLTAAISQSTANSTPEWYCFTVWINQTEQAYLYIYIQDSTHEAALVAAGGTDSACASTGLTQGACTGSGPTSTDTGYSPGTTGSTGTNGGTGGVYSGPTVSDLSTLLQSLFEPDTSTMNNFEASVNRLKTVGPLGEASADLAAGNFGSSTIATLTPGSLGWGGTGLTARIIGGVTDTNARAGQSGVWPSTVFPTVPTLSDGTVGVNVSPFDPNGAGNGNGAPVNLGYLPNDSPIGGGAQAFEPQDVPSWRYWFMGIAAGVLGLMFCIALFLAMRKAFN